jgi:serine/threonine protein kinase
VKAGDVIADRYRAVELLGEGGMGQVWLAEHVTLGKRVALKVLHPQFGARPDYRARFLREARVSSKLHHPAAVGVHDFGEHAGILFLVMDLLEGRPLRAAMNEGPLPHDEVRRIVRAIADLLDVAHAIPLVHRDLKPENVMLVPRPVVVDFGLAFVANTSDTDVGRMTNDGILAGSPAYMSPEQCSAAALGPPSDIYALGVMLYELLVGRLPFEGGAMQLLGMHLYVEPRRVSAVSSAPEVAALDDLVAAMLAKAPDQRPRARVVADVLDGIVSPVRAGAAPRAPIAMADLDRTTNLEPTEASAHPPASIVHVAVWGPRLPQEVELACALAGIGLATHDAADGITEAIAIAPEATGDEIAALVQRGVGVIAGTRASDLARIVALLRTGAVDVVQLPLDPAEVVRKVHRAVRDRSRASS